MTAQPQMSEYFTACSCLCDRSSGQKRHSRHEVWATQHSETQADQQTSCSKPANASQHLHSTICRCVIQPTIQGVYLYLMEVWTARGYATQYPHTYQAPSLPALHTQPLRHTLLTLTADTATAAAGTASCNNSSELSAPAQSPHANVCAQSFASCTTGPC